VCVRYVCVCLFVCVFVMYVYTSMIIGIIREMLELERSIPRISRYFNDKLVVTRSGIEVARKAHRC